MPRASHYKPTNQVTSARSAILDVLLSGPQTAEGIEQASGLTPVVTRNRIRELCEEGIVEWSKAKGQIRLYRIAS